MVDDPRAGQVSSLLISFSLHFHLQRGSEIHVGLPNFIYAGQNVQLTASTPELENVSLAGSWRQADAAIPHNLLILTLTSDREIPRNTSIKVRLSWALI